MTRVTILISVLIAFTLSADACSWGDQPPKNEKRYPIKGVVVAVNQQERTATIKHEDIPGYMQGMTMDFKLKNAADLQTMKPGDQISRTSVYRLLHRTRDDAAAEARHVFQAYSH